MSWSISALLCPALWTGCPGPSSPLLGIQMRCWRLESGQGKWGNVSKWIMCVYLLVSCIFLLFFSIVFFYAIASHITYPGVLLKIWLKQGKEKKTAGKEKRLPARILEKARKHLSQQNSTKKSVNVRGERPQFYKKGQ